MLCDVTYKYVRDWLPQCPAMWCAWVCRGTRMNLIMWEHVHGHDLVIIPSWRTTFHYMYTHSSLFSKQGLAHITEIDFPIFCFPVSFFSLECQINVMHPLQEFIVFLTGYGIRHTLEVFIASFYRNTRNSHWQKPRFMAGQVCNNPWQSWI